MFVGITNTARDYSWGSRTAISALLGTTPTGEPEAEVWLGAHPGSPAVILDPANAGGARTLAEWIAADPATALHGLSPATASPDGATATSDGATDTATSHGATGADEPRLPFLMKVLAAASPLSLQAHPTPEQARAGFAREEAAGVPIDAPFRNYKDAHPKPELMLALSDTFEALCGFRAAADVHASLAVLERHDPSIASLRDRLGDDSDLPSTFEWLISRADGVDDLVARVVAAADAELAEHPQDAGAEFATVQSLAQQYPGDPGIVISLLINRVSLRRGEVLYLPAGNIHAYLDGLGIEVMASSDNVLRGGLTPKHVDIPELLSVLDFAVLPVPYLPATELAPGVAEFRPDVPDFMLVHVEGEQRAATLPLEGPAIVLCLSGTFDLAGAAGSGAGSGGTVTRGEAVYVTPDETPLLITGSGELVLATTGR